MSLYLGYVVIINYHYNFRPFAEIVDGKVNYLSDESLERILPDSSKRDIELGYRPSEREQMESLFAAQTLIVVDFETDDLIPNCKQDGTRYPTGYKVEALTMEDAGKILRIHDAGVYHTVKSNEIRSDFYHDSVVDIDAYNIVPGEKVFVELDGFWAGPYTVGYRELTSSFYIKPQIRENKYTVSGYCKGTYSLQVLSAPDGYSDEEWPVLIPPKGTDMVQLDVMTDEDLVAGFVDSLENGAVVNGSVQVVDIPALLTRYEESELSGNLLSDKVRTARIKRIKDLMTAEAEVDATLATVTDYICDLLVRYKDHPNVDAVLQVLLDKDPTLLERLSQSRTITGRIAEMERQLEDLFQQRTAVELDIAEKAEQAQANEQKAVEESAAAMLKASQEYSALCERLEAAKIAYGIVGEIGTLQQQHRTLTGQISYLDQHKTNLTSDTRNLEMQFLELVNRQHEKMVGIAFDGFMANKMLEAASQWETEESDKEHDTLITKINEVACDDMEPAQLIDYLCRTIQIVRPGYSRNTIVNIAICMTQGFLTVFSGEPGCGKTSICNLFGDVLGLNKLAQFVSTAEADNVSRYVSVPVERGWTSKRDFVGYYNPLSKKFDKSNRRIYDALHQLDTEKKKGLSKFPFIILLDEANLSPMEHYWSDFMNICDDLGPHSKVNLGEEYIFSIPETLHFVATINNDHTTEELSPRLIDRAWIVSLPKQHGVQLTRTSIPADKIQLVSWSSLRNAFIPTIEECKFTPEVQQAYKSIVEHLNRVRISVSPRIDLAIKQYWAVASKYFEKDETDTKAAIVALDYAVMQKLLPKISGNSEEFEKWLDDFRRICSANELTLSAKAIMDIIERGKMQLNYYRFFG